MLLKNRAVAQDCTPSNIIQTYIMQETNLLSARERADIINLIKREVVPATGCTEPVAVALAVARAMETVPEDYFMATPAGRPFSIKVSLSGNMIKNAMGVGIPGTGMTGLPIAIALGATIADSSRGLDILSSVTPLIVEHARKAWLGDNDAIEVTLEQGPCDKLYIDARVMFMNKCVGRAVISGNHTNIVLVESDGKIIIDKTTATANDETAPHDPELTMARVWDLAMNTPVEDLKFILEARRLNKYVAEQAMIGEYGHRVGRTLHCARQRAVMGDSVFSRILSYTSAACDARMGGAPYTVMSNSGSGNQGIAATIPVVVYAEETYADEATTIRALTLSHLTAIYIKQSLGRLSALCGCVVAATGSAAAICYLMGGDYDKVCGTVKNMVANITGMICDGAKPSCALKLTSGVSTAVLSAMVAMEGQTVGSLEGIVDDDVDRTVHNLTLIGREAMDVTDQYILNIMTSK